MTFSEETIASQIGTNNDNSQVICQYNFNPNDKLVTFYEEYEKFYECKLKENDVVPEK